MPIRLSNETLAWAVFSLAGATHHCIEEHSLIGVPAPTVKRQKSALVSLQVIAVIESLRSAQERPDTNRRSLWGFAKQWSAPSSKP